MSSSGNEYIRIFVVDDDESVRRSLLLLLKAGGYYADSYSSAEDFLSLGNHDGVGCILLDIIMEGRSGLELQEAISERFPNLPIIYITGQGNVPLSVQAMKKGAINFLQKPVEDHALFNAVEEALNSSKARSAAHLDEIQAKERISTLTARELEVYRLIITGMLNKQIAARLNITEHTVKLHRGKITDKLGVKSVAEMLHLAERANIF
jgi:FixJ family two-component response regulator